MNFINLFTIKNTVILSGVIASVTLLSLLSSAQPGLIADSTTIKKWITEGALVVDVRTAEEFAAGNYRGAINIPLAELEKNLNRLGSRDKLIVVYCRSGNRSGKAKEILERNGYKNVLNGGALINMPR